MSADNGIYILETVRNRKQEGCAWVKGEPYKVYRVAHAQAIDNFDWYKKNEPYNLGAYMVSVWGKSEVFMEKEKALACADKIASDIPFVEYGISTISTDMVFFGDM